MSKEATSLTIVAGNHSPEEIFRLVEDLYYQEFILPLLHDLTFLISSNYLHFAALDFDYRNHQVPAFLLATDVKTISKDEWQAFLEQEDFVIPPEKLDILFSNLEAETNEREFEFIRLIVVNFINKMETAILKGKSKWFIDNYWVFSQEFELLVNKFCKPSKIEHYFELRKLANKINRQVKQSAATQALKLSTVLEVKKGH